MEYRTSTRRKWFPAELWSVLKLFFEFFWNSRFVELDFLSFSILRLVVFFLRIFFEPIQPCFRVLLYNFNQWRCIVYLRISTPGENDFLLREDTCHGLTSTRARLARGVTRHPITDPCGPFSEILSVQRRHLSRDVEFYERIKGGSMLSFSRLLEIATSKLRPIQFDPVGDNDSGRSDPILPIIRGVVFSSIRFDSTRLDSDQTRRFCHRLKFRLFLDSEMEF